MDVSSNIDDIPDNVLSSFIEADADLDLKTLVEINEKLINFAREKFIAEHESKDDSKSEDDDSESEDDEDQESNLHTDRSCISEGDKSMDFSADQNKLGDSGPSLSFLLHHYCDILRETKLHHEQEILSYKQNINELQSKLNSKVEEVEDLTLKNSELQKKYQHLQIEKNEWINKISEEFAAQKKCQMFLESGAIEEINILKLQVRHLEEEKSNFERENSFLKESFFRRWTRSLRAGVHDRLSFLLMPLESAVQQLMSD